MPCVRIRSLLSGVKVWFRPEDIAHKTMKTMDNAAKLAMLPDYEMYCVDLHEGINTVLYI